VVTWVSPQMFSAGMCNDGGWYAMWCTFDATKTITRIDWVNCSTVPVNVTITVGNKTRTIPLAKTDPLGIVMPANLATDIVGTPGFVGRTVAVPAGFTYDAVEWVVAIG
jgi:hypothetical protein